jgi:hypothetical protein
VFDILNHECEAQRNRCIGDVAAKDRRRSGESESGWCRSNFGARTEAAYFNCDEIEEKVVLSFVPRPFTTLMIATEMPAAIRPYSMAVAAAMFADRTPAAGPWVLSGIRADNRGLAQRTNPSHCPGYDGKRRRLAAI